jgi:hypothetical protein
VHTRPGEGPTSERRRRDEVLSAAIKRSGQEIEDEDLDLPGGLQEEYELTELPAMKAADVRECVVAIAAHTSLDPDELLEAATAEARFQAAIAAHRKEDMERELSREVVERVLPDDETLQKIARYEAHLSRQLYHALHELEALQSRRLGGNAPLARLDVQGIPDSQNCKTNPLRARYPLYSPMLD